VDPDPASKFGISDLDLDPDPIRVSLISKFYFIEELLPLLGGGFSRKLWVFFHKDHSRNMSVDFFSSRNFVFLDFFAKEKCIIKNMVLDAVLEFSKKPG
jgi:hypothetical protein